MARDYTSSVQRSPARQDDVAIRLDRLGEDDTLLLGEHSYDNFLDGLDDDVSFAVPKFSDRYEMRENRPTALPRPKAAEPLALRAVPTHYDRGTVGLISQYPSNFSLEPNVEKTLTRTAETPVVAEQAGKENAFLTNALAASQCPPGSLIPTSRTLNMRPHRSNVSKIPIFAPTVSSTERLARAFSAFDSLDDQLNNSVLEKQHTQAIEPTSPPTSRPIDTAVTASQAFVAKTLSLSTSSFGSMLHSEDYAGDGTGNLKSAPPRNGIEELQPDCQASQTPVAARLHSQPGNVSEDAFPDHSHVNDAPCVNDADQGGDYEEHAVQGSFPACDNTIVLSSPSHPAPIEPAVSSGLVGDRFGNEQICLSDLAHDSVTPPYHQSRSVHQHAQPSSTYDIPGPGAATGTLSSSPQNPAVFPETAAQVTPTAPASRKKSVGGRRYFASAIPDWVHFVASGGSGHDRKDGTPFSPTAVPPSAPVDAVRGRLSGPSDDHSDDIQVVIISDLPTARLVGEDGENVGLNGPQDTNHMAETVISSTSTSTTLPNMPRRCSQSTSVRPAASLANLQMDSAESSSTNPITSDSAEPLPQLTMISGVGIETVDSLRTLPRHLHPTATVAHPTKNALVRKASAPKLATRTKPIRDVAPKPRVVSNPEHVRPKATMRTAQVPRGRTHTKGSSAAGRDHVRVGPEAAALVSCGVNVEPVSSVPTVAASGVGSLLPLIDMAEQGSRGNGSLSGEGLRHSRHSLSDITESNSVHSLSRSIERVLQHASAPAPPRDPSMDQDGGTDPPIFDPAVQTALTSTDASAAIRHSIVGTPQREPPILDSQMPATAAGTKAIAKPALSDQRDTTHGVSLISCHPRQQRDRANGASTQHKPVRTANKATAMAHPRPKPGVFTHSSKISNSRQQPGSQELHAHSMLEAPLPKMDGRVVDDSAVPVAQDDAAAHSEPNVWGSNPCDAPRRRHAREIPVFSVQPAEEHAGVPGGVTTSYPQTQAHEVPLPESSDSEPPSPQYQTSPSHASPGSAPCIALGQDVFPRIADFSKIDSAAGNKRALLDFLVREKLRAKKKTRIGSDNSQSTVPFPLLRSQRPHEPIAGVTIDEREKGEPHVEIAVREPHMANAEPEMVPLVVKKAKRKSLDNIDDGNHRKRVRTHGRDPRRIVSHNTLEQSAPLRRPPRAPVHLPIVQPLAAPVPGEASRLRALEREKRLAERLEKERHEKRVDLQKKMGSLDLSQPSSRPTSSNHTCSAPKGPFTFATDHRAEQHRANFEARLAHWEIRTQEAMRQAQPRVAGRPIIPDFAAAQADHTERVLAARQAARAKVTEPKTPGLKTKGRIVQRREFEEQLKEKERQLQLLHEEQQAEAEEMERLRVKQLRKRLDDNVKANPIPKWYKVHDDEDDILILEKR